VNQDGLQLKFAPIERFLCGESALEVALKDILAARIVAKAEKIKLKRPARGSKIPFLLAGGSFLANDRKVLAWVRPRHPVVRVTILHPRFDELYLTGKNVQHIVDYLAFQRRLAREPISGSTD
jgi:hypothetical protein